APAGRRRVLVERARDDLAEDDLIVHLVEERRLKRLEGEDESGFDELRSSWLFDRRKHDEGLWPQETVVFDEDDDRIEKRVLDEELDGILRAAGLVRASGTGALGQAFGDLDVSDDEVEAVADETDDALADEEIGEAAVGFAHPRDDDDLMDVAEIARVDDLARAERRVDRERVARALDEGWAVLDDTWIEGAEDDRATRGRAHAEGERQELVADEASGDAVRDDDSGGLVARGDIGRGRARMSRHRAEEEVDRGIVEEVGDRAKRCDDAALIENDDLIIVV